MLEETEVNRTAVKDFVGILNPVLDLPCVRRMLLKKNNKKLDLTAGTQDLLGK